jgi:hypothetical protein
MENQRVMTSNDRQLLFIDNLTKGLTIDNAWKEAGYTRKPPNLPSLLRRPDVVQAIGKGVTNIIRSEDRPRNRAVLAEIREDTRLSPSVRIEAIRALESMMDKDLDRSGEGARDKAPSEMSGDELRVKISMLESELVDRSNSAKVIDGVSEPVSDDSTSVTLDILD